MLIIIHLTVMLRLENQWQGIGLFSKAGTALAHWFSVYIQINHLLIWHYLSVYPLRTPLFPAVMRTQIFRARMRRPAAPKACPSGQKTSDRALTQSANNRKPRLPHRHRQKPE
jgi:hypothetical protein